MNLYLVDILRLLELGAAARSAAVAVVVVVDCGDDEESAFRFPSRFLS